MSTLLPLRPVFLLEEGSKAFNPIDLSNESLLFWTVVVFLFLLAILWKFVWGPLMRTVNERESRIRGDLDQAEASRREAEELREGHRREMEEAAQRTKAILEEARERASRIQAELEGAARVQAEAILARAKNQIEAEKLAALQAIRDQVVDLSVEITRRLVERSLDREDHLREAEQLLARMKEQP